MIRAYHLLDAQHGLSNISLRRLKISRLGDLNDPFELLAGNLSDENFRQAAKSWKQYFHKTKGLLCFSRAWRNPVLWSHYADKHRGICLGFDIPNEFAQPVSYKKTRLPVQFAGGRLTSGLDKAFVLRLLCTKFEHWKYEKEVRMFVGLDEGTEEHGLYFMPFSDHLQIQEIIIGPLCEIEMESISALAKAVVPWVAVKKARLAFNSFSVVEDRRYSA